MTFLAFVPVLPGLSKTGFLARCAKIRKTKQYKVILNICAPQPTDYGDERPLAGNNSQIQQLAKFPMKLFLSNTSRIWLGSYGYSCRGLKSRWGRLEGYFQGVQNTSQ